MNYQPPSFESSCIGSFEFSSSNSSEDVINNQRPLSPLNKRTSRDVVSPKRGAKKTIVLKSSARDTQKKNKASPSRPVVATSSPGRRSDAVTTPSRIKSKDESLLNAGLSATEMLARLRQEKEILIQQQ